MVEVQLSRMVTLLGEVYGLRKYTDESFDVKCIHELHDLKQHIKNLGSYGLI